MKTLYKTFKDKILPLLVIFFWFLMSLYFFLLLYPFKPVKLNNFVVTDSEVYKGDFVHYNLDFTKNYNIKPEVSWHLVDGGVHELRNGGINRPVGANQISNGLYIPDTPNIEEGMHFLQVDLTYKLFSFREPITYSWQSNEFMVLER